MQSQTVVIDYRFNPVWYPEERYPHPFKRDIFINFPVDEIVITNVWKRIPSGIYSMLFKSDLNTQYVGDHSNTLAIGGYDRINDTKTIHRFSESKIIRGTYNFWVYKAPNTPPIHINGASINFSMTFIGYADTIPRPLKQLLTYFVYEYSDVDVGEWDFNKLIKIPFLVKKFTIINGFYDDYSNAVPPYKILYSDLFKLGGCDNGFGTMTVDNEHIKTPIEYVLPYPTQIDNQFNFRVYWRSTDELMGKGTRDIIAFTILFEE